MSIEPRVLALSGLLALSLAAPSAFARISLCVEATSERDAAGFEQLLRSEIERHPSHIVVTSGCESSLRAELFELDRRRFLTLRVDGQVPVREAIQNDGELEEKLADAVSRVLHSDPLYLAEDAGRGAPGDAFLRSVLARGRSSYRLSVFEAVARSDTGAAFAPGAAFEFARGSGHFGVWGRLALAGRPGGPLGTERVLGLLAELDAGVVYETSARAETSAYFGVGAGATFFDFSGRVDASDAHSLDRVESTNATFELRAGVRFLRLFDFDCDAFVLGGLPLSNTRNPDAALFGNSGAYTPFMELGLGIGFL